MRYQPPTVIHVADARSLVQGMQTGQKVSQPYPDGAATFSSNPPAYEADE